MIKWTPALEDEFLEIVLLAENDLEYQRALVKFARLHGRDSEIGLKEGDQFLRRRANRRTDYVGPLNVLNRMYRAGKPFTWAEQRILDWALDENLSERKKEVSDEYIANLLQRTSEEIVLEKRRRETTRNGIPAFFE